MEEGRRMRTNTAKQKMLQGKPAFGYSLGLGSPIAAEMLASSGIDFILLDNQHGSFGPDSTIACFMAMAGGAAIPMARTARNDYTMIGRLLDEGAMGIVVPMVHTAEDAKAAADCCRLPPVGTRSWGWGRAARYGGDYPDRINDEVFVAVQLESIQAVENAEAILSTPGVDGCWAGPADMALSMGIDPRNAPNDDRHIRALERVVEACRNTGKIAGLSCSSPEEMVRRAAQGFQFLTGGGDGGFIMSGAAAGIKTLGL
jgi:4-hydroxy-2-oxoheptanedioate aldolase